MDTQIRELISHHSVEEVLDRLLSESFREGIDIVHLVHPGDTLINGDQSLVKNAIILAFTLPQLQSSMFHIHPDLAFLQPFNMVLAPVKSAVQITVLNPLEQLLNAYGHPALENISDELMRRVRRVIESLNAKTRLMNDQNGLIVT